jgi:hypothetical protein
MNDNVVYLGGKHESQTRDTDGAQIALRGALVETIKSFRAGEIRAAAIISIEKDGSLTWRIAGNCADFEIISALERTKFDLMMEG